MSAALSRSYPEVAAGGYTRFDGTIEFYGRVSSLISASSTVLDLGAGRASWISDPVAYRRELRHLKGRVNRVIGVDVDEAIFSNPTLDEALVMPSPDRIPLDDASVDVVVADYVLEHVQEAEAIAAEVHRILKVGGWFCARTPNRRGMTGVVARLVPNSRHVAVLRRLQPGKASIDTFPTAYKMNEIQAVGRLFAAPLFDNCSYVYDSEPGYVGRGSVLLLLLNAVKRLTPRRYGETLMIFVRKLA